MVRNLVLVLGDQLSHTSPALQHPDPSKDLIWMAEVHEEATHVWSHQLRIAFFFSAARHFCDELKQRGLRVQYRELPANERSDRERSFANLLAKDLPRLNPEKLVVVQPGDFRVLTQLRDAAKSAKVPLEVLPDPHFYCAIDEFHEYARDKKKIILEMFYRQMRKKHRVLINRKGEPEGGTWNFDKENRATFKQTPSPDYEPLGFPPDAITQKVMALVRKRFPRHPGSLDHFTMPVSHGHAQKFLRNFIHHALPDFGKFQDAMWTNQSFLYHSRLSALLNLKLLDPRECVALAVEAYEHGRAPLNSVEGFVRQILGWREFVHGIYWHFMPEYVERNFLNQTEALPAFYWTGNTDMACMHDTMQNILQHGYAHHIQRLMVAGLFALLYGANPREFHEWHMAMYLDAIDWVSLPNALGMSQYADGGVIGTKPYCATGNYIDRMSNYCENCRYNPQLSTGDAACPFTTLYYDFLDRHQDRLKDNARLKFQILQLQRKQKNAAEMRAIREQAKALRTRFGEEAASTGRASGHQPKGL